MKKLTLILSGTLFLVACGVDGPPVPPEPEPAQNTGITTGVQISGSVGAGIRR